MDNPHEARDIQAQKAKDPQRLPEAGRAWNGSCPPDPKGASPAHLDPELSALELPDGNLLLLSCPACASDTPPAPGPGLAHGRCLEYLLPRPAQTWGEPWEAGQAPERGCLGDARPGRCQPCARGGHGEDPPGRRGCVYQEDDPARSWRERTLRPQAEEGTGRGRPARPPPHHQWLLNPPRILGLLLGEQVCTPSALPPPRASPASTARLKSV